MGHRRATSCSVTAFEVTGETTPVGQTSHWLGIATSQVYDADVRVEGLSATQRILLGETMVVVSGRGNASTEAGAMHAALEALLFELAGRNLR